MSDEFTTAARAVGADPDEVRESMRNALAHAEQNGLTDAELLAWVWHAGAEWARDHLAAQKPTDAEVLALIDSLAEQAGAFVMPLIASMALQDSRSAVRRDKEKRDG